MKRRFFLLTAAACLTASAHAATDDTKMAQDGAAAANATAEEAPLQRKAAAAAQEAFAPKTVGNIERLAPGADRFLAEDAAVEQITPDVFGWTEGPVWVPAEEAVYFTDVPGNGLYRWSEAAGLERVLVPSGDAGPAEDWQSSRGANGLIVAEGGGALLMAVHGDRAIVRLDLDSLEKTQIASRYDGKRFSSPNDLVQAEDGSIYFTDPPYGLADREGPAREIPFAGVYRLDPEGAVELVEDGLGWPNGVDLSPSEDTLYVTVSRPTDGVAAGLYAYPLGEDGRLGPRRMIFDATEFMAGDEWAGAPDGLDIAEDGTIFLASPPGVHVLSPEGEGLAVIETGTPTSNVTLGEDEETLFIASSGFLARVGLEGAAE